MINKNEIVIYEIIPCNLLQETIVEQGIYQKYLRFIKGVNDEMQIIIKIEKMNFKDKLNEVRRFKLYEENEIVKELAEEHYMWIEEYLKEKKTYKKRYYIVIPRSSSNTENTIALMIEALESIGVIAKRIESKLEVEKIVKSCIEK